MTTTPTRPTTPTSASRASRRSRRQRPPARSRVSESAADWALASRLVLIDRVPHLVDRSTVWTALRLDDAFRYRWEKVPPDALVQQRYDTLVGLEFAAPVASVRSRRDRAIARDRYERGFRIVDANMGPGRRLSNSLQVAVAVDASLGGAPATALDWRSNRDPVRVFDIATLPGMHQAVRVDGEAEARRVVASWGPGAKGIVSVRDPGHVHHRVMNTRNMSGDVVFLDYSSRPMPPSGHHEAQARADEVLGCIDTTSPFASVMLWRSTDIAGECRLPDDWLQLPSALARRRFVRALEAGGSRVSPEVVDAAIAKARFFNDRSYTNRLLEALIRGECTFGTAAMAALGTPNAPLPLTGLDHAVSELARHGELRVLGGALECAVADNDETRAAAACFGAVVRWTSPLDGVAPGSVEYRITADQWQRLDSNNPRDVAPPVVAQAVPAEPAPAEPVPPRQASWIDVNRAFGPGQRRTNCWNCSSAVANWVRTGAASTGLPVYRDAPFRPTIPEFLAMVGAADRATYLEYQSREAADAVVRRWGPSTHGLVVASLTEHSTHIFNVVVAADGVTTRYLDGHTGTDGVTNFDNPWLKIGLVRLEGSVAASHRFSGAGAAAGAPAG